MTKVLPVKCILCKKRRRVAGFLMCARCKGWVTK